MGAFRWTEEAVQAFEKRKAEWEANGTVRTHKIHNSPEVRQVQDNSEPRKRRNAKIPKIAERSVLKGCIDVLNIHPKVAFAWRQNTGLAFGQGQAVRFSFKGCSDLLGMLRGGRLLAVEVKATGKTASADQEAFLEAVRKDGGFAICVDDPQKLITALEGA